MKNELYLAFREKGRVIRRMFQPRYINDSEMRRTIHAATNKSEQFNDLAKWLMFGGNVIAENLRQEQRKDHPVDAAVPEHSRLSARITNRLCSYLLAARHDSCV